ncbi:MAG: hypothetical protein ACI9LY_002448, partial [Arenicella sp.]
FAERAVVFLTALFLTAAFLAAGLASAFVVTLLPFWSL